MRTAVAAVLAAAAVGGCASHAQYADRDTGADGTVLMLQVENDQWYDMDIYLSGTIGAPQLVGIVPARSAEYFELSKQLFHGADELRLIADAYGSTLRVVSDPLEASHSSVRWQLKRTGSSRLTGM